MQNKPCFDNSPNDHPNSQILRVKWTNTCGSSGIFEPHPTQSVDNLKPFWGIGFPWSPHSNPTIYVGKHMWLCASFSRETAWESEIPAPSGGVLVLLHSLRSAFHASPLLHRLDDVRRSQGFARTASLADLGVYVDLGRTSPDLEVLSIWRVGSKLLRRWLEHAGGPKNGFHGA